MKRLISAVPFFVAAVVTGCGSRGGAEERVDDFEGSRDNLTVQALNPGQVLANLSGTRGEEQHFSLQVPAGATHLRIATSGGSGDADLYVRFGADTTRTSWDYRPFLNGNNETVSPDPVSAGTWFLMVRAFRDYSGVTLTASFDPPVGGADAGAHGSGGVGGGGTGGSRGSNGGSGGTGGSGGSTGGSGGTGSGSADAATPPPPGGPDCTNPATWPSQWVDFENQVLTLVNARRAAGAICGTDADVKPPVPPLVMEEHLRQAARCHSLDMGKLGYFDHNSQDGRSPWVRIAQAGYTAFGNAENIAAGYSTPDQVMEGWMNSPGHCSNIMTNGSNEIGIGLAVVTGSPFENYWTQDFGQR